MSQIILPNSNTFVPGTVKPEEKYDTLRNLGRELGIPVPEMFVGCEVRDAGGNITSVYNARSRTVNRNFWNFMFLQWAPILAPTATFGAGLLGIKDITGTVRQLFLDNGPGSGSQEKLNFGPAVATVGTSNRGIVIGTGTTAESFEHNALAAQIAHGTGAGQMTHNLQNTTSVSYNSGTKVWTGTITRIFNNNSGGTIVVAEVGMYGTSGSSGFNYMFTRDLLGSSQSVANAGQLTVTYTTTLTFPA